MINVLKINCGLLPIQDENSVTNTNTRKHTYW